MPSRVIHTRIDDWVLLGCHDIMKQGDKSVENLPMSTLVKEVLTAFVRKMQEGDYIPAYSQEELIERIEELSGGALDTEAFDPASLFVTEPESELDIQALALEAAREIAQEGEPDIAKNVEISELSKLTDSISKYTFVDITKLDSLPWDDFVGRAPKDRFIEWAIKENNGIYMKAVAITYSNMPQSQWGSQEAETNILDLIKRHREK